MLPSKYHSFYEQVAKFIDEGRIHTDYLKNYAFGIDGSFYQLTPKIVIDAKTEAEVVSILKVAQDYRIPVTFRAAGTSLSGQAITDSVLIRTNLGWKGIEVLDEGKKIALEPGVIGSHANIYLAPYGQKIGPDPASIDSCQIGGILANNASGMCCGIEENSYQTIEDIRVVFANGAILDTSSEESRKAFLENEAELVNNLMKIHSDVNGDKQLVKLINKKFKIKNTTGYGINSLVDFNDPIEIIKHLIIGSEGTLAFISKAYMRTVVEHPNKASALMLFPDIKSACEATIILKNTPVDAVELMDYASLKSVSHQAFIAEKLEILPKQACALLVETRAATAEELQSNIDAIVASVDHIAKVEEPHFTPNPEEYNTFWAVRKGLFATAGGARPIGTTIIIEDVSFPLEDLAKGTLHLQELFDEYKYHDAVIFGHALEGNLHFIFAQDFNDPKEVKRYENFLDALVTLVADKYKGSLKAEHGTGRNMAPFVELEWGETAYRVMSDLKNAFDPLNIINPGVIINKDKQVHLKNLKLSPQVDSIIDKCIECGFCEPICPSRNVTMTPRQRIAAYRHMETLSKSPNVESSKALLKKSRKEYDYLGIDTCAADSLCKTRCPVGIDTGKFIKELRAERHTVLGHSVAAFSAKFFGVVVFFASLSLPIFATMRRLIGGKLTKLITGIAHKLSFKLVPQWFAQMPRRNSGKLTPLEPTQHDNSNANTPTKVVYFPSCLARATGTAQNDKNKEPLTTVTLRLLQKAGVEVIVPNKLNSQCCGQPFESKGYPKHGKNKSDELEGLLLEASNNGEYPVLCDTSPCTYNMVENMSDKLNIYEPVGFVVEHLQDKLTFNPVNRKIAIHSTCTNKKMGLDGKLKQLASRCATEVVAPLHTDCCGFAGDRGLLFPELNEGALMFLKDQVDSCEEAYSTSRMCEVGLAHHSGLDYKSILYLVDEATTAKA